MYPGDEYLDDEIKRRFQPMYDSKKDRKLSEGQIPYFREKCNMKLSEQVKISYQVVINRQCLM